MPQLRYKESPNAGSYLDLTPGVYTLGRTDSNQIVIPDPSVSSRHCEIVVDSNSIRVKDLGSTNGTRLNGGPIQEAELTSGNIVQFGNVEMICDLGHPSSQPAVAPIANAPSTPKLSVNRSKPSGPQHEAAEIKSPVDAMSTPKPTGGSLLLGMDRTSLESQARAKIFWGEPVPSVISYMTSYGYSKEEAVAFTNAANQERVTNVRKNGFKRIVMGVVMMPVPFGTFLYMKS